MQDCEANLEPQPQNQPDVGINRGPGWHRMSKSNLAWTRNNTALTSPCPDSGVYLTITYHKHHWTTATAHMKLGTTAKPGPSSPDSPLVISTCAKSNAQTRTSRLSRRGQA